MSPFLEAMQTNRLRNRITVRAWRLRGLRQEDFAPRDAVPVLTAGAVALLVTGMAAAIPVWLSLGLAAMVLAVGYWSGALRGPQTAESRLAVDEGAVPGRYADIVDDAQMTLRLAGPNGKVLDVVSQVLTDVADANRYTPRHAAEEAVAPDGLRPVLVNVLESMEEK